MGILKGVAALEYPKSMKINVVGELQEGVYAKDVILHIIGELTVNGATDLVIEFGGEVIKKFSMEERMTIANMTVDRKSVV